MCYFERPNQTCLPTSTAGISWKTAAALVIANMVGTGVFTSLGYQLLDVQDTVSIVLLWVIGGAMALFGAFSYGQLGTHFAESGGDYIYLSRIFHPVLGYLSSWVSLLVGFSAPVAIAAIAMTQYLAPFGIDNSPWLAIVVIVAVGLIHSFSLRRSSRFQNVTTVIKVAFVLLLIGLGILFAPEVSPNAIALGASWQQELTTPGFAVSLIYVSYAYTGWNSAAYIAGEIRDVRRSLPRALIAATLLVTVLYVALQLIFLKHASVEQLQGQVDVATVATQNLFGTTGGRWVSFFIALQLVATIGSYIWIGPRVTHAMAREHSLWKPLRQRNAAQIPVRALWLHVAIAVALTLTGTFEQIVIYAGFVLQLNVTLVVASVLFLKKRPASFRSPFYPYAQYLFIAFSVWILGYTLYDRPTESLIGLGIIGVGLVTYFFSRREAKTKERQTSDF